MNKIYLYSIVFLLTVIGLFVAAFICLDQEKHDTYYYEIIQDGRKLGDLRIDRYVTEDKRIYQSSAVVPFSELDTKISEKITTDREYELDSYSKETVENGVDSLLYIENRENVLSFVSRYDSRFLYLESIPAKKYSYIFKEDSLVTYLPIVENYDFRKGRAQGFDTLTFFSQALPPATRYVTVTSVTDEYIKIGKRKVNTEKMFIKIRGYPQCLLWVSKSDKSIIKLKFTEKDLKIVRTFSKVTKTENKRPESERPDLSYVSRQIDFKNGVNTISGTFSCPKKEGKYPGILLVPGAGPQDRDNRGIFLNIAEHLAKNGFCVLRFDKRGVGLSGGNMNGVSDEESLTDLKTALQSLSSQPEVDARSMAIISHAEGSYYTVKLAIENDSGIKGVILMAPKVYSPFDYIRNTTTGSQVVDHDEWSDSYRKLLLRTIQDTDDRAGKAKFNWTYILGKRCYVKNMREDMSAHFRGMMSSLKIPTLILQCNDDNKATRDFANDLDRLIAENGNLRHGVIFYDQVGQCFGEKVWSEQKGERYDVDQNVLNTLSQWLNLNIAASNAGQDQK